MSLTSYRAAPSRAKFQLLTAAIQKVQAIFVLILENFQFAD